MRKADVLVLFDYMYWANWRLLDLADRLSTAEFVASSAVTTRGLRATLVHELDVEWSWRLRLRGVSEEDEGELRPEDYPDVATLRAHWQRDETEMREWLAELTDEQLAKPVSWMPTELPRPLWHFLMHIFTHASQQQADAATLLSLAGHSPGELEFLSFLDSLESKEPRP
jgi:uncharacterized damage-inducible protein DinB